MNNHTHTPNKADLSALSPLAGSAVFVIFRDPHPEPWEDWSSPYRIAVGEPKWVEAEVERLNEAHPGELYFSRSLQTHSALVQNIPSAGTAPE